MISGVMERDIPEAVSVHRKRPGKLTSRSKSGQKGLFLPSAGVLAATLRPYRSNPCAGDSFGARHVWVPHQGLAVVQSVTYWV